jgi:hypothetical protein
VTHPTPWGPPPAYRPLSSSEQGAMAAVYAQVDADLAPIAGACRACGQCCRFTPGGIVLFATALEMAYLVGEASLKASSEGDAAWACPYQYQDGTFCTARQGRLLGCRTYFCDSQARTAGEAAYAGVLGRIREVAAGGGLDWYGPARLCLASWSTAGKLPGNSVKMVLDRRGE